MTDSTVDSGQRVIGAKPHEGRITCVNRLFYKKGCQEHSSPFAVSAVFVRDIQPLVTTEDASLGLCPWV